MLLLGIGWALRPLARLREEVSARRPDDLEPIVARDVPSGSSGTKASSTRAINVSQ